jgi:hypothetical protein
LPSIFQNSKISPSSIVTSALAFEIPSESWRWHVGVFLGYLLLGVLFTWPLLLHLNDSVVQITNLPVDTAQNIWNLWWVRTALLTGEHPYITRMVFYPEHINLFYQTVSLPNSVLALPVTLLVGPVAAFNSIILLSFGLGGYWTYRLARAFTDDRLAALAAGFVFVCTPYHIRRIYGGAMEVAAIFYLPLYVIALARALARRTPVSVLRASLTLFVTTLAAQYYGLYAVVYTALHTCLAVVLAPYGSRRVTFLTGAGCGILWGLMLLPLLFWAGAFGANDLKDWYERQVFHSMALVDLVAPNPLHPIWGEASGRWLSQHHIVGAEVGAGFGIGVALLVGVAIWRHTRLAWTWMLLALMITLFAMGPQLRVTEAESGIPGPFLLLDILLPFRNASRPAYFVALLLIPVSVLVAIGVTTLRHSMAERKQQRGCRIAVVLIGLMVFENIVTPLSLARLTAASDTLALNADPLPGAVLDLPPRLDDGIGLLNQICHGRPLMGGYLARTPFYPMVAYSSAMRHLWLATEPLPDIVPLNLAAELASLGARFVVLDLTQLPRDAQYRLREQLDVPGIHRFNSSETREIYAVDPQAAQPVVVLGAGWHSAEREGERRWRWIGDQAEMLLLSRERTAVILSWRVTAYKSPRSLRVWLDNQRLTEIIVPAAPYDRIMILQVILRPGRTIMRLESEAERVSDGRRLSLSFSELYIKALPVSIDASQVVEETLDIPPTLSSINAPPCR